MVVVTAAEVVTVAVVPIIVSVGKSPTEHFLPLYGCWLSVVAVAPSSPVFDFVPPPRYLLSI